ncbi:hypothetical protein FACS189434_10340 [Bacteroidia bacterium]|nr:hypothetical protein FACS189434_10340 [Bacteroidia bacterium]
MDNPIHQLPNYSLWKISENSLAETVRFVVETNYKRYLGNFPCDMEEEIKFIYNNEKQYFPHSCFYVIKDNHKQKIIGSIRITHWTPKIHLPIQNKFGVDIESITKQKNVSTDHIWHIGRFAIDYQTLGKSSVLLLKTLLVNGFQMPYTDKNAILLAELDKRLFEKLKLLGIHAIQAGKSEIELGSETVPVYITSQGLLPFFEKHKHLCYV